ncbi:MAG: B12-binding domain-containing radical SAM protein, partial [Gammaproteobacteria bacterium]|nr:B12-binding domain-containing radical SAM protein [Gammaproteobacteria bacterium]
VDLITWAREGVKWPRKHRGKPLAEYDYMPAWDLADQKIYRTPDSAFPVSSMGSTLWSRGCAFECVFCSGPGVWKDLKPRVKYRPVNRVVDELELLSTKYNIKRIYIHDDTLNTNVDILGRICDEIIRRKVKIQWFGCGLRADKSLTPQWIFEKMKQAGCWGISFGVESGDQYVLDKIKKRVPLEDVTRALSLAKGAGLRTAAGFTVGHVWLDNNGKLTGETPENLDKTVSFVKKLIDENLIYSIWVAIITPFPGSELWEYVKNSRVDMYDEFGETYLKNGRVRVMFKHPILSDDQIADYYTKIFHMVGFNFKHAIRRLLAVREWGDLRGIILGGIFVLKRTIPHAIKKFMHAKDK